MRSSREQLGEQLMSHRTLSWGEEEGGGFSKVERDRWIGLLCKRLTRKGLRSQAKKEF